MQFVKSDIDAIRAEAARGYGEEISTLAYLLHEPDASELGRWMQRHYVELFVGLEQPEQLLDRINPPGTRCIRPVRATADGDDERTHDREIRPARSP